jgi:hypothetical protein
MASEPARQKAARQAQEGGSGVVVESLSTERLCTVPYGLKKFGQWDQPLIGSKQEICQFPFWPRYVYFILQPAKNTYDHRISYLILNTYII